MNIASVLVQKYLRILAEHTQLPYEVLHYAFITIVVLLAFIGCYFAFLWLIVLVSKPDAVVLYNKLNKFPFGRKVLTSAVLGYTPYSGSTKPYIEMVSYTNSKISVKEHRAIQNPFRSIHLAALVNLGEFSIGLPVFSTLGASKRRGIPVSMSSDFKHKATGKIHAVCEKVNIPKDATEYEGVANIYNSENTLCTTIRVLFKVSDIPAKKTN